MHAAALVVFWPERAEPVTPPVAVVELQLASAVPPGPPPAAPDMADQPPAAPAPPAPAPAPEPPPPTPPPTSEPPPTPAPEPPPPPVPPPPPPEASPQPRPPPQEHPRPARAAPPHRTSRPPATAWQQPASEPPAESPAAQAPAAPGPAVPQAPSSPAPAARSADPNAVPSWQRSLLGDLQHAKRYPDSARQAGDQGTATVSFTLDRSGHVLAARLVHGSGSQSLDDEAVALIRRAEPLPPPPAELPGATVTLVVPIRFSLR